MTTDRRHFESGGDAYLRYRPTYPRVLAEYLAGLAPDRDLAVDVACGNGQLSVHLAEHFERVGAFDISADQVAHAEAQDNIVYALATAESLPVGNGSVSLITVAQAAHWLDLPAFYEEVRRVAKPGAVCALITYQPPVTAGAFGTRFAAFHRKDISAFWPPGREHVERGGLDLPFPFEELPVPGFEILRDWTLPEFLGYIETWSATKRARAAGRGEFIDAFRKEARHTWGDASSTRRMRWPVQVRTGRVSRAAALVEGSR